MGLPMSASLPMGEIDIHAARRGIIRARNRPSLSKFTRAAVDEPRYVSPEFTADDLRSRVDRFEAFIEESARQGATLIVWG